MEVEHEVETGVEYENWDLSISN